MGGTLYLSRISEAISLAPNEFMHVMSEPAKDVTCAPNEILTFGGWYGQAESIYSRSIPAAADCIVADRSGMAV